MKLLVDFDDVLFDNAKLKEKFFSVLESHGVKNPRDHYTYERANDRPFSLKGFIARVCKEEGVSADVEAIYEEVMSVCGELRNERVISLMLDAGIESSYILTSGEEEFQHDKIARSRIGEHAHVIIVVPGSKAEEVERICQKFPNEDIIFADDKEKFFKDIDMTKCPNLKTVLFVGEEGIENFEKEVRASLEKEFAKAEQSAGPKMG